MASNIEIIANSSGKSQVWKYFGFVKDKGEVDKKRVGCNICKTVIKYSGNTTNLTDHLRRKHPDLLKLIKNKDAVGTDTNNNMTLMTSGSTQSTLIGMLKAKLPPTSPRARSITQAITRFIVKDLRPYSVVENSGFKHLIHTLDPAYCIPSRQHFSDKQVPDLYDKVKQDLLQKLKGQPVTLTTDGWTSRATESYITITSCHIDDQWQLNNFVLQTRAMPEAHTAVNIARVLSEAVDHWQIQPAPPIVSDNASNMVAAMKEFDTSLHLGCFAHTLNLACGKALKLGSVSKLLARMRRIVSYFHRSALAASMLVSLVRS